MVLYAILEWAIAEVTGLSTGIDFVSALRLEAPHGNSGMFTHLFFC
jgi:hypothetical protein